MLKVLIRLPQLVLIVFIFSLSLAKTTQAAACQFTYRPDPPNQNMGSNLDVTISSNDIKSGIYRLVGYRPNNSDFEVRDINFTGGSIKVTITTTPEIGWPAGIYKLYLLESKPGEAQDIKNEKKCFATFTIPDIPISSCKATIESKPIDPDTGVVLAVNGITKGSYDIFINGNLKFTNDITPGDRIVLGNFDIGIYAVTIKSRCGFLGTDCIINPARLQCNPERFEVAARGSGGGGQIGKASATLTFTPCKGDDCSLGRGDPCGTDENPGFKTAIGCIHTNPTELVKDFLKFIIAISGGFAFLMMLLGAYQMLTSAGNPDSLNAGRERLTSAISGLLFVIFAVLLLQIIGVDILFKGLPGFGR